MNNSLTRHDAFPLSSLNQSGMTDQDSFVDDILDAPHYPWKRICNSSTPDRDDEIRSMSSPRRALESVSFEENLTRVEDVSRVFVRERVDRERTREVDSASGRFGMLDADELDVAFSDEPIEYTHSNSVFFSTEILRVHNALLTSALEMDSFEQLHADIGLNESLYLWENDRNEESLFAHVQQSGVLLCSPSPLPLCEIGSRIYLTQCSSRMDSDFSQSNDWSGESFSQSSGGMHGSSRYVEPEHCTDCPLICSVDTSSDHHSVARSFSGATPTGSLIDFEVDSAFTSDGLSCVSGISSTPAATESSSIVVTSTVSNRISHDDPDVEFPFRPPCDMPSPSLSHIQPMSQQTISSCSSHSRSSTFVSQHGKKNQVSRLSSFVCSRLTPVDWLRDVGLVKGFHALVRVSELHKSLSLVENKSVVDKRMMRSRRSKARRSQWTQRKRSKRRKPWLFLHENIICIANNEEQSIVIE